LCVVLLHIMPAIENPGAPPPQPPEGQGQTPHHLRRWSTTPEYARSTAQARVEVAYIGCKNYTLDLCGVLFDCQQHVSKFGRGCLRFCLMFNFEEEKRGVCWHVIVAAPINLRTPLLASQCRLLWKALLVFLLIFLLMPPWYKRQLIES